MEESKTIITKKNPVNVNIKKAKSLTDSANKLSKAVSDTAQTIAECANGVTRISEHMNDQEEQYLAALRSPARDLKRQVLEDAINNGTISTDEALEALTEMRKEDMDEHVRLIEAKAKSNNAQGNKAFKIGAGVGIGAIGTGILIGILNNILGGDGKPA